MCDGVPAIRISFLATLEAMCCTNACDLLAAPQSDEHALACASD